MGAKLLFSGRAPLTLAAAIAAGAPAGPVLARTDIFTQYQETGNPQTPTGIGKLFLNCGYCSASVISGNNIIVTAAHCCCDRTKNNWIGLEAGPSRPHITTGTSELSMHSLGYPGNIGGGNNLELCASESFASCGSDVLNTGCSMTFGSSGGPWIRDYRTGNHVDSVVHGQSCTGTFGKTFDGASFTSNNIVTLCNDQGC